MQHDNPWQIQNSDQVYEDEWVKVFRDTVIRPDGRDGSYTFIENTDSVLIIAVKDLHEIYLEWTYRYPTKSWGWELPGGGISNEEPQAAAQRELREEVGYEAEAWDLIGKPSVYSGLVTGMVNVFTAHNLSRTQIVDSDDSDITNTGRFFAQHEITAMIKDSSIVDSQTLAALYQYEITSNS